MGLLLAALIAAAGTPAMAAAPRPAVAGASASGVEGYTPAFFSDGKPNTAWDMIARLPGFAFDGGAQVRGFAGAAGNVLVRSRLDAQAGGKSIKTTSSFESPWGAGKFKINALALYDRYTDNEDDALSYPGPGTETLHDNREQSRGELGLHYEQPLSPRESLEVLAIQQAHKQIHLSHFQAAGEDDLFREADTSGESIARAVYRFRKSDAFSTEIAAEGAFNIQDSDSRYTENGADVALPAARVTVSERRGELSASATWKPSSRLMLEAGGRAEVSNIRSTGDVELSKTLFYPKPRVVLTWSPDARDQVRLRVERELGQLDFADFAAASSLGAGSSAVQAGNPNLVPQQSWVAEAAYEKHVLDWVLVATARHSRITDVIDRVPIYDPSGAYDAPGNIGTAEQNEIELNLTVPLDRLGIKRAQIKAQGTFRDSRVADPTTGQMRRISGQHPWDGEAHFTQDLPRYKVTWGVDAYNYWRETYYRFAEIDTFRLKTWVTLFAEYKPRPDLGFRMELDNIGARGFERVLNVYAGPRNTSPLLYVDDRRQDFKPFLYLRVRKTFA